MLANLTSLSKIELVTGENAGNATGGSLISKRQPDKLDREFWHLWLSRQEFIFRLCLKWMGGNRHEAEDACSLVMLKAREKFFRYSRKLERPKAWLTRLARNLCIDIARRKNRETRKIESIDRIDPETSPKLISPIDPPEKLLLETEMTRVIYRKISALPPLLKTPFALFFYRSMSPLAIARHLGISVEAIYKRLRKARSLLRESLEGYRFSSPIEA